MVDLHAHVLPGVDDGARDVGESLEMLGELGEAGFTEVVATPHFVFQTRYESSFLENSRVLEAVRGAVGFSETGVGVRLGNEIYVGAEIGELAERGVITGVGDSRYLLIELPMSGEYQGYEDIFLDLMQRGYRVILAHPERYAGMKFEKLEELTGKGVLLQCNLGSFIGQYGKNAQKMVKKLARAGMIFGIGSDIHRPHGVEFWRKALTKMRKYCVEADFERILNPNF